MTPLANPACESEWPLDRMLDELWLRVHRVLVHSLETAHLWLAGRAYDDFLQEQWKLGERLKADVLSRVLGEADYARLGSDLIFGPANGRFRRSLPYALAFGYQLGYGFSALLATPVAAAEDAACLSSVFNLGISVFDVVCDHSGDQVGQLKETLNEGVLRGLAEDADSCRRFSAEVEGLASPELRVLLKIIAWFFSMRHQAGAEAPIDHDRQQLAALLLTAYRVELATTLASEGQPAELLTKLAREKSTLPFAIIAQIARLNSGLPRPELERALDQAAGSMGQVFWLLDDLVDMLVDLRAGSLNSILVQAGIYPSRPWELSRAYAGLARLIRGSYVEDNVENLLSSLAALARLAGPAGPDTAEVAHFQQTILGYVRYWIP